MKRSRIIEALSSNDPNELHRALSVLLPLTFKHARFLLLYGDLLIRLGDILLERYDPLRPEVKQSYAEAALYYRRAYRILREKAIRRLAKAYLKLADVHLDRIEYGASRIRARQAGVIARSLKDERLLRKALEAEFKALVRLLKLDEAERIYGSIDEPSEAAKAYYGRLKRLRGEVEEALRILRPLSVPEARLRLAEIYLEQGKKREAARIARELMALKRPYSLEASIIYAQAADKGVLRSLVYDDMPSHVAAYYKALALALLGDKEGAERIARSIYLPPFERKRLEGLLSRVLHRARDARYFPSHRTYMLLLVAFILLALGLYLYRTRVDKRISYLPLLASAAYFAYSLYLLAVSPISHRTATLLLLAASFLLSLPARLVSRDDALRIYAFSIAALYELYRFPDPEFLNVERIFYELPLIAITITLASVLLYSFFVEVAEVRRLGKLSIALVIVFLFVPMFLSAGSFRAAVLENVPSLDLAAIALYSSSLALVYILAQYFLERMEQRLKRIAGEIVPFFRRSFLEEHTQEIIFIVSTVALLFIFPPLALIPPFLRIIGKVRVRTGAASIALALLIAAALLAPHVGIKGYEIQVSPWEDYPVSIDDLRLVDRPLFIDIITSAVRLNLSVSAVELIAEAANVGLIDGKPMYIAPFVVKRYSEENNRMLGYVAMPLDRPVPEAAIVKYVEMSIAPGLLGLKDLSKFIDVRYGPKGYRLAEYYLIDDEAIAGSLGVKNPFRVCLLEHWKARSFLYPADFVVLVDKEGNVKEAPREAVPQGIAAPVAFEMLKLRGSDQRDRRVDYTASGALWIPPSATLLSELEGEFYARFHHVLQPNGRLRDAYFLIKTANYESAVVAILNGTRISLYDLRSYSFGGSRGVVVPDRVLDTFEHVLSSSGVFGVNVRYPKLYKYGEHLLRISLVIEERPDADRVRGVVFAEAANTRIAGFVEYSYGEPIEVFLERLKETIDATYAGYTGGAQTQTAYVNGTVLRIGSFLTEYQGAIVQVFVFYVLNDTEEVMFLVHPAYVASYQEYYKASLVKPGDHIEAYLRYVIELQARCAYSLEISSFYLLR